METVPLYPLRFEPILRELIWGGRRLGTVLHKPIGEASDYAESWEISDYKDQVSVVSEGPLAGTTLRELVRSRPLELLGPAAGPRKRSRCSSSSSMRTRTYRCRSTPMMRRAGAWPTTVARPRRGSSWPPSRGA